MSIVTYEAATKARIGTSTATPAATHTGWFARIVARLIEARQKQAMDEIRRHSHPLPQDFERADRR